MYYQQDPDNESIHIYNLDSQEDVKVNDETSYNITVDYDNSRIYYTTDDNKLKSINYDGSDEKTLLEDVGTTFVMNDEHLYMTTSDGIVSMDLDGSNQNTIIEDKLAYVNIFNNQLVYVTRDGIASASLKGKNEKLLYKGNNVEKYQVIGDKLIVDDYDSSYQEVLLVVDENGKGQNITGETSNTNNKSQEIEGAQDF